MNKLGQLEEIEFQIDDHTSLKGRLRLPDNAKGLVIFSHGSGSSRLSSRNNYIAELLKEARFSSLLFDLLTEKEDMTYANRFDIPLITKRLVDVTNSLIKQEDLKDLPFGYFGASTGAASALKAAAKMGEKIKAVVSRGGRPDLVLQDLKNVHCATLLIVGGDDKDVIKLNSIAFAELNGVKRMEIIPGATHLFSEPGKLEEVAKYTIDWFNKYLK